MGSTGRDKGGVLTPASEKSKFIINSLTILLKQHKPFSLLSYADIFISLSAFSPLIIPTNPSMISGCIKPKKLYKVEF